MRRYTLGILTIGVSVLGGCAVDGTGHGGHDTSASHAETPLRIDPGGSATPVPATRSDPADDEVVLDHCAMTDEGRPLADVTVTNHGSEPGDYRIVVEFRDTRGTWTETGTAPVLALPPNREAKTQAAGTKGRQSEITCRVVTVERSASAQ